MEERYFDLKDGEYIRVIGDELEIKARYSGIGNELHKNEVVRDKIKNFRLLYFSIPFGPLGYCVEMHGDYVG